MNEHEQANRLAVLTATVDQLQADHDRLQAAITLLLVATAAMAVLVYLDHRMLRSLP